ESGPTPEQHPTRGMQMLREKGWPEDMLQDIASHADYLDVPRDSNARKALYAVDEMCGFIIACALVKPDKSLSSVEASTVRKKMKDKAFARGVHREELIARSQVREQRGGWLRQHRRPRGHGAQGDDHEYAGRAG